MKPILLFSRSSHIVFEVGVDFYVNFSLDIKIQPPHHCCFKVPAAYFSLTSLACASALHKVYYVIEASACPALDDGLLTLSHGEDLFS